MDRKTLYKSRGIFPEISADKRSQKVFAERQEKQLKSFWSGRVPDATPVKETAPVAAKSKELERLQMLYKWKEERKKKLEDAKKKQKPVFKVGVVHRSATGSPLITDSRCLKKPNKLPNVKPVQSTGVLTRATAKRTGTTLTKPIEVHQGQKKVQNKFCKIESGKKKKIDSHMFKVPDAVARLTECKLTFPNSPKLAKNKKLKPAQSNVELSLEKAMEEQCSLEVKVTKENVQEVKKTPIKIKVDEIKEKAKIDKMEVEENKENVNVNKVESEVTSVKKVTPEKVVDDYQPIHFSPFVTVRSGRKSERRSGRKSKKSLTINVDEIVEKEQNEFKCRIFSFRKYIQCETRRLLEACDKWKKIYEEFEEVPNEVEGDIDAVIGKTNLLTSDKFMQFKGLIDKCENGDPFIKIDDLVGFQDWVAIEVEKIDEEFNNLEKRKLNNWKLEIIKETKQQKVVPKKAAKKPVGKSNIRSHILAARKLLKESNANGSPITELPKLNEVIKATTPRKTPTLLKQVLTSETKKRRKSPYRERRNSGLEIMIATQKNKLATPVKKSPAKTDYEIFVEDDNTPCKSILKKTPKPMSSAKARVTFKKLSNGLRLSESYFKPTEDSPDRTILKDLVNITPDARITRSKSRQLSLMSNLNSQAPLSPIDPFALLLQ